MTLTRDQARQQAADHKNAGLGTVMALLAALCGGSLAVAVGTAAGTIPSTQLLFIRFLVAAVILGIWQRRSISTLFQPGAKSVWILAVTGAIAASCYYSTLQATTVGTAMMIANLSLPLIVLFSRTFLGERLKRKSILGMTLMLAAVSLLKLNELTTPAFSVAIIGFSGAVCLAVSSVMIRQAAQTFTSQLIVFMFSAATCCLALVLPGEPWDWSPTNEMIVLIAATVGAGMMANLLYTSATRHLHAGIVSGLTKTSLLWAVMLNFLVHGQTPLANEWGAYLLTLLAVLCLQEIRLPSTFLSVATSLGSTMRIEDCKDTLTVNLEQAVEEAELKTSCEFKFHVDSCLDGDVSVDARKVFSKLGMDGTEFRNGVLIAWYGKPMQAVVVMDKGITTHFSKRHLRRLSTELFRVERPGALGAGFSSTMLLRLPEFASQLSAQFPLAVDDLNEISNGVSFALT